MLKYVDEVVSHGGGSMMSTIRHFITAPGWDITHLAAIAVAVQHYFSFLLHSLSSVRLSVGPDLIRFFFNISLFFQGSLSLKTGFMLIT